MASSGRRRQPAPESAPRQGALDRCFRISQRGSHPLTEVRAGIVTFLTMSYILFVNPQILGQAGMPKGDVAVATALAAAAATLLMGLLANLPFALAPGMGLNAYFAFGVVGALGVGWRVALAAVFVEGVLFLLLSVSGARRALLNAIPRTVKVAIMSGIGLFLAIVGLQGLGLVVAHPQTLVTLGDPSRPEAVVGLVGLLLIAALLAARVHGAILLGIAAVTAVCWLTGLAPAPESWLAMPHLPRETFLALDLRELWSGRLVMVVLAFLFVDLFDTAGTLIGVGRLAGFLDEREELPQADRAFAADAVGTAAGALLGTSTVTTYVESATGVEEGGRTGLTAVVVAFLFLASLVLAPAFSAIPAAATAPALIAVGALMMRGARELDWLDPEEGVPAFLTVALMPFTYSIANGISLGIVSWTVIKLLRGKVREIPPLLGLLTLALLAFYAAQPVTPGVD